MTKLENRLEALRLNVMDSGGVEEKVEGFFNSFVFGMTLIFFFSA